MKIKLADLVVLPPKKYWVGKVSAKQETTMEYRKGYNQRVSEESELVFEIDEEAIAKEIFKFHEYLHTTRLAQCNEWCEEIAKALAASAKTWIKGETQ